MKLIGLDAGSVSIKIVLMDRGGAILKEVYERHKGHPLSKAYELLQPFVGIGAQISVTGSAGKLIADIIGANHVNEIVAQSYSTRRLEPTVRTIIELGGEDSKLILLDNIGIKDFSMNSVCAAGTGSFLDQQAERMKLTITEFAELSTLSKNPPRIAGRCSVFAKSDMIHLQQIATPIEDIVAGLCFAVARNFKGSIVKGRALDHEISFQGGVALNAGMVRAFKEILEIDHLVIPKHTAMMGAIGTAYNAIAYNTATDFTIDMLNSMHDHIKHSSYSDVGKSPLISDGDGFMERHVNKNKETIEIVDKKTHYKAFMGIDIGSISTNLALIDESGELLSKRYIMTASRPIEAVMGGLKDMYQEFGDTLEILGVATTGSGRYMISDFVGADFVKNEITAQAKAAVFIDNKVDTIFEIGGQDSKYISIQNGVIVDFEMNKACAAGTGSFLEEQAEKLNISIKEEFAGCALSSCSPCSLGERCTVFMENSLMANLQRGADDKDLLAGLAYSIVENYINRVVAGRKIGDNIFFQGGTAFNKAVVAAFEKFTGKIVTVPPNHDVTGAIGMALIAKEKMEASPYITRFKGFSLWERHYSVSSFECKACANVCEINKVKIDGETRSLFYGGRCEKYDEVKSTNNIEDIFAYREGLLWKHYESKLEHDKELLLDTGAKITEKRPKIGIPYIFFFHEFLPFWTTLLTELGFDVVVSPKTNRQVINLGLETVLSESCFPVKVAHGHIKYLIEQGIEDILIPSFVNISKNDKHFPKGSPCPYTQTIPYLAKAAFKGLTPIAPIIDFTKGQDYLIGELRRTFGVKFNISSNKIRSALKNADAAMIEFYGDIQKKGAEVLSRITERTIVIIGRTYNAFDSGINLQLPKKLAGLNVLAIPLDFLPLKNIDITDVWEDMYWRSGQTILKAARFIKDNPLLYPVYIGNFNCGPDSFILNFFREEMGDIPFLNIEIDEHSADAGAVTRCEAFLDSIENVRSKKAPTSKISSKRIPGITNKKIVYIPRMSDHSLALAAAFKSCGVNAEVLPVTDTPAIELGRKYISGKECYPCVVTTGDLLKKVMTPGFDTNNSIFFMPSGTGPCRFGQYNVLQKLVLKNLGLKDVQIYSPVQDTAFYKELGLVGGDFVKTAWKGIVAIELLTKCLHETRPYEKNKGQTDTIYNEYLQKTYNALCGNGNGNGNLDNILRDTRSAFEAIPKNDDKRPLIGVIGEIFVRSNKFSNEDIVRKIEALGGQVWLAPVEEWIYYVNHIGLKHALIKKDLSGIIGVSAKRFFQKRIEHRYSKYFEGFLKSLHEPDTADLLKKAVKYVDETFEGETVLSIGKSIDLIDHGANGIINAMPFGCMPGTIVTALMRAVSRDYNVPTISVPFDGSESATMVLQLEAFMEQAVSHMNR